MDGLIIAIDAGTTGVRSLVVNAHGVAVDVAYRELTQHFPRPGWVEHNAMEIWSAICATLAEVLSRTEGPVDAVGITNQRETVVAWSRRSGRPLGPALVWQDRRTAAHCQALIDAGHLPNVRARTGLVLDPYFSATKMAWLFDHGVARNDHDVALGTVDSWVLWKLTGGAVHATDTTNASRTLLYDITRLCWSAELCELFGVPERALPDVRPSAGRFAGTAPGASPLPAGVAVSGIAGDQQAALFGQACFTEGMTKNTYGTGSFVLMNVGTTCPPVVDGLLSTVAWTLPGNVTTYAYEGAIFVTGATVQWLRDGLGLIAEAAEVGPLAASVSDSGGVYLVPAFTGLGSPWWDPHARGAILGLTRGSTGAHLARAAVDAMAFQTRDVVDTMTAASGRAVPALRVDGGAAVMDLLLSIQADQLGVPVTRPLNRETTALGAAHLAGLGAGTWSTLQELAGLWQLDAEFTPTADRGAADVAYAHWHRAVERARHWAQD